ncbi:YecA family protein [Sporosarcina sp. UB5]|uniref:YecA family protein n=1 Tax=Sporosarcina sp. UB5 TaxID=3047463 RepID=UPI003D7BE0A4
MKIKFSRNDPCLCGSGKKYKKCCLGRNDNPDFMNVEKIKENMERITRERLVKQCIHLKKEECSSKIIKAHSLQNNRILSNLAVDGYVSVLERDETGMFMSLQRKGRKVATTFSGFCSHHDKTIFQPIEDRPFIKSEEQLFLLAYRAFALGYHKKLEQIKMNQSTFREKPSSINDERFRFYSKGLIQSRIELESINEKLNEALESHEYGLVKHYIWEINEEIEFAISTVFEPEETLNGIQINDFMDLNRPLKSLYVSILPMDGKSYFIFSYLKENEETYKVYFEQFNELNNTNKKKFINNMLAFHTEHVTMSPRLLDRWTDEEKEAFYISFHFSTFERIHGKDMLQDSIYDFFKT